MAKFRKSPVLIYAEQYVEYGKLVKGMCNSQKCYAYTCSEPHVHTIHNHQMVLLEVGDWILPEPDGEHFYPCKPDIFKNTYKPLGESGEEKGWASHEEGLKTILAHASNAIECVDEPCKGYLREICDIVDKALGVDTSSRDAGKGKK